MAAEAHISLPSQSSFGEGVAGRASALGTESGRAAAWATPAASAFLLASRSPSPFWANFLWSPAQRLAGNPQPSSEEPEHHAGLCLVGPRGLLRHLGDGNGEDQALGEETGRRGLRRRARLLLVDHQGGFAEWKLGAELEEVLPVEDHRDIQRAPRIEHPIAREAHPARRLAAADLRAEALGEHRV
jgi:hypothetical protein